MARGGKVTLFKDSSLSLTVHADPPGREVKALKKELYTLRTTCLS